MSFKELNRFEAIGRISVVKKEDWKVNQKGDENSAYLRFNLAISDGDDKDGNDVVDFIPCVAFGKTAINLFDKAVYGGRIWIAGRLQNRSYKTKDGETRYSMTVRISNMQIIDWKDNKGNDTKNDESSLAADDNSERKDISVVDEPLSDFGEAEYSPF